MQFPQHQCFRSFDSIEFFEVKVTLEKVADKSGSLLQVFSFAHEEEESALVQVKKKSMTFKWQQKVLSPRYLLS